jgi:hypothetical protein
MKNEESDAEVDPREFLRAVLHISPEDAEKVREETPGARKPRDDENRSGGQPDHDGNQ